MSGHGGAYNVRNIAGQRFGMLVAVTPTEKRKGHMVVWLFRCDCGGVKELPGSVPRSMKLASCGCATSELLAVGRRTHGEASGRRGKASGEYDAWCGMLSRCYKSGNKAFHNYGGRGITVCDRWRTSFAAFLADMGRKPTPDHSIDRKDNNGHYEPGNCRWATDAEQARNQRRSRLITIGGRTRCLSDWAREAGLNRTTLRSRLARGIVGDDLLALPRGPA